MRLSTLFLPVTLALAGCSGRVETDDRPAFAVDPARPFRIEFGRGSGWDGLDTVTLDETGRVVLHRLKRERRENANVGMWDTATLQLAPPAVAAILQAVESNGLTGLHKAYHVDRHDGTQWVLWVKQGGREKTAYFDNDFPRPITRFAARLDAVLAAAGQDTVAWQPVPDKASREHEHELWESIGR